MPYAANMAANTAVRMSWIKKRLISKHIAGLMFFSSDLSSLTDLVFYFEILFTFISRWIQVVSMFLLGKQSIELHSSRTSG